MTGQNGSLLPTHPKKGKNRKLLVSVGKPYTRRPPAAENTSAHMPPSETKASLAASLPEGQGEKEMQRRRQTQVVFIACVCIRLHFVQRQSPAPDGVPRRTLHT